MSTETSIVEELQSGKSVTYFTVGDSMKPLLRERKTHVTVVPHVTACRGDILLYARKNGALVLHRCIKLDADAYYMRGDNTYGLERIEKKQAIGIATHVYRNGRQIDLKGSKKYKIYTVCRRMSYPFRWTVYKAASLARRFKWKTKKEAL